MNSYLQYTDGLCRAGIEMRRGSCDKSIEQLAEQRETMMNRWAPLKVATALTGEQCTGEAKAAYMAGFAEGLLLAAQAAQAAREAK